MVYGTSIGFLFYRDHLHHHHLKEDWLYVVLFEKLMFYMRQKNESNDFPCYGNMRVQDMVILLKEYI